MLLLIVSADQEYDWNAADLRVVRVILLDYTLLIPSNYYPIDSRALACLHVLLVMCKPLFLVKSRMAVD